MIVGQPLVLELRKGLYMPFYLDSIETMIDFRLQGSPSRVNKPEDKNI